MKLRLAALAASIVSFLSIPPGAFASGSADWRVLPALPISAGAFSAAADQNTGDVYVFGGSEPGGTYLKNTWVYRKGEWRALDIPSPEPRIGHVLVSTPSGIVLFGGMNRQGQYLGDTWLLRDDQWKPLKPASSPPARVNAGAAWDYGTGSLLLFGGFSVTTGDLNDTWLLRDDRWIRASSWEAPSPRSLAALAGHAATRSILLIGGFGPGPDGELEDVDDSWIWKNGEWSQLTAEPHPSRRSNARTVQDPTDGRIDIFSGFGDGAARDDLWSFDGVTFASETIGGPIWSYASVALVENPLENVVVVVQAKTADESEEDNASVKPKGLDDTWIFDGQTWREIRTDTRPTPRAFSSMAYDPDRDVFVLFGGGDDVHPLGDTWEFDGERWMKISAEPSPSARVDHRMIDDPELHGIWLLGGFGKTDDVDRGDDFLGDAWLYRNGRWTRQESATLTPARSRHCAWYAASRKAPCVGFGQDRNSSDLSDIYHWTGRTWIGEAATGPTARSSASATSLGDQNRLLFGGASREKNRPFGDTWIHDGQKWIEYRGSPSPSARFDAGIAALPDGRAVLFGGFDNTRELGDTWIFDGTAWTSVEATLGPSARRGAAMAGGKRGVVLFGGIGSHEPSAAPSSNAVTPRLETWSYDGKDWQRIPTSAAPSAVIGFGWCYDSKRDVGVLFGGFNEKTGDLNETWVFDGKDWKMAAVKNPPPARTNPNLVWDPKGKTILLFGGHSQTSGALRDMWRFDGVDWTPVRGTGPPAPFTGGTNMIYSDEDRVFWLFGVRPTKP